MGEPSIARGMRPKRHPLDEDSASRLLQGLVHPDDAPPGYGPVAGLLNSAAHLPMGTVDEDAAAFTVSAMVEVIRNATPTPETSRRKTMLGKLLAGKALAAVAVLGLTATGAAAATGSLPDPAQGVVSDALSHVGVDIPHPNHGKSADHRQDGKHGDSGDEAPNDDTGQSGDESKGMSGIVAGLKDGRLDDAGPLGQEVCQIASSEKCRSGDAHPGKSADDESTPSSGSEEEQSGEHGKSGEDHGRADDEHPTTPKGSIATGEEKSGRKLPSGKGKPGTDE
jgi:hypothetical protein